MKKLLLGLFVLSTMSVSAQILTGDSFAKYDIDKYDGKPDHKHQYVEAATSLKSRFELDKNDQMTYTTVIDCPNMDKDKIYDNINGWFTKAFADKSSSIQTNDKASGTLVATTTLKSIVTFPHQIVSVSLSVKINIKDGKLRLVQTINEYIINSSSKWAVKKCYPFYDEQDALRKKIGSSAYVASCVFAEIVEKQLNEAAKPKAPVNDNDDDW
ncbi:MAG: DUF4468 domain-containing protein [Salinivirgaceae bacterium]|nr:DUF4468 domain-containing protein [Salinivirgaceae bacterium]